MTGEVYPGEVLPMRHDPNNKLDAQAIGCAVARVMSDPWDILPPEQWTRTHAGSRYEDYPFDDQAINSINEAGTDG